MNLDAPKIREKFLMSSQGERLFTITTGAALAGFICFLVVGCVEKSGTFASSSGEVQALSACNEQPSITIRTYAGSEKNPGAYSEGILSVVERDKYLVQAVSKCRMDVLDYFARKHTQETKN